MQYAIYVINFHKESIIHLALFCLKVVIILPKMGVSNLVSFKLVM
jgi:hypothetical protein